MEFRRTTIQVENIIKQYKQYDTTVTAVNRASFSAFDGEFVAIIGASGSGKSTLLHICAGLDRPNSGTVRIRGTDITSLSPDELAEYRGNNMGIVFQNHNLIPQFTALENILVPTIMINKDKSAYEENFKKIVASLGIVDRLHHLPSELSGGQQQRVAIARALINMPLVLFADEPTGNLDKENADEVLELLIKTQKLLGQTLIMVTHDMSIAARADRVLKMDDGVLTAVNKERLLKQI
ncbi:MAG: ABC transporter ATP-binding protein [Clostridia bacterium]|nr:ABC transporter ATP-binding protein [Clostridia bacterium]